MDFPPFPPISGSGLFWDGTLPSGAQSGEDHTSSLPLPVRPATPVPPPSGEDVPLPDGTLTLESSDAFTLSLSQPARDALLPTKDQPVTLPFTPTVSPSGIPTPAETPSSLERAPVQPLIPAEPSPADVPLTQTKIPNVPVPLTVSDAPVPLSPSPSMPQTVSASPPTVSLDSVAMTTPSLSVPANTSSQQAATPTTLHQTPPAVAPLPMQTSIEGQTLTAPLPPELPPLPRTAIPFPPHQPPEVSATLPTEQYSLSGNIATTAPLTSAALTEALADRPPLFARILQPPFPLYLFGNVTVTMLLRDADENPPPPRPRSYDTENGSPLDESAPLRTGEAIKLACILHDLHRGGSAAFPTHICPWYAPYVHYAVQNRLIQPDFFTDFAAPITRGELARLLSSALPAVTLRAARDTFCERFAPEDTLPRMEAAILISRLARS